MRGWGDLLRRRGGGAMGNVFCADLFSHWDHLAIQIVDFSYERMDYRGDSELPRLVGQAWGTTG